MDIRLVIKITNECFNKKELSRMRALRILK